MSKGKKTLSEPSGEVVWGVNLEEVPEPHRWWFDDKRHRRGVTVTIGTFFGVGHHFYAEIEEQDDYVWDSCRKAWRRPWVAPPHGGQKFEERWSTVAAAERYVELILADHFPRHKVVSAKGRAIWRYREGD